MKIRVEISLKTIVVLIIFTLLLVFITCYMPDSPLRIGYWDQGTWDVDAWGE